MVRPGRIRGKDIILVSEAGILARKRAPPPGTILRSSSGPHLGQSIAWGKSVEANLPFTAQLAGPLQASPWSPSTVRVPLIPSRGNAIRVPRQAIFSSRVIREIRLSSRSSSGRRGFRKGWICAAIASCKRQNNTSNAVFSWKHKFKHGYFMFLKVSTK